jgi:hypothetical protein
MVTCALRSELLSPTLGTPLAFPASQSIIEKGLLGRSCVRMYHYGRFMIPSIYSLIVLSGHHDWGWLLLLQLIQHHCASRR